MQICDMIWVNSSEEIIFLIEGRIIFQLYIISEVV